MPSLGTPQVGRHELALPGWARHGSPSLQTLRLTFSMNSVMSQKCCGSSMQAPRNGSTWGCRRLDRASTSLKKLSCSEALDTRTHFTATCTAEAPWCAAQAGLREAGAMARAHTHLMAAHTAEVPWNTQAAHSRTLTHWCQDTRPPHTLWRLAQRGGAAAGSDMGNWRHGVRHSACGPLHD